MNYKLTNFLIAITIVSCFVFGFGFYFSSIEVEYGVDYDNSTLGDMNKLEDIQNATQRIQERNSDTTIDNNWYDIMGNMLGNAIDTARIGTASFSNFQTMTNKAFSTLNLHPIFYTTAVILMVIAVFVGILLRYKLRQDP